MRFGEVSLSPRVEEVLDSVEVEKEGVAAAAGKKYVVVREERPSGFGGMIFRIVRSG
jgi:hypothetical protein